MGEMDKMLHAFAAMVSTKSGITWSDIPDLPHTKGSLRYYYCEERLYLFQMSDGKMFFSVGGSPRDAFENWTMNTDQFIGCVR